MSSDGTSSITFKVHDIVNFIGTKHHTNAGATVGPVCKPGKAEITRHATGRNPWHVVAIKNGGSTVHGWVESKDIEPFNILV